MKNERDAIIGELTTVFTYIMVSRGRNPIVDYPHPSRPARVQFGNSTPLSIGYRRDSADCGAVEDWNLIAESLTPFTSVRSITVTCLLLPLTFEEITKTLSDADAACIDERRDAEPAFRRALANAFQLTGRPATSAVMSWIRRPEVGRITYGLKLPDENGVYATPAEITCDTSGKTVFHVVFDGSEKFFNQGD